MRKRMSSVSSLLVFLILMYQLVVPFGSAFASTSILPPSNLAYEKVTPDDGKLTWSSVYGASGYNVYEIKEGQLLLLGSTKATSYNFNNLEEGTYSYVVSTLTSDGESGPSAPVSFEIIYPDMVAPSSLTNTIQNGNDIVLSWTASPYAESYNIYEVTAEGSKTFVTSTSARTYTFSNAAEGKYSYAVTAANSLYGESSESNVVAVDLVHPVMTNPGSFSFTISNGNDVDLKWQAVSYASNYKIYQIIDGKKEFITSVKTTSAKLSNLPAGDYVYQVYSFSDRFGESAEGSEVSLTIDEITMATPSNFTVTTQNVNDVVLKWNPVSYATGYNIYQVVNGEKVLKSSITGTTVTYTYQPGGDYVYVVSSYSDRFGESADTEPVSVHVETVTMENPANFHYKIQNGNDIALSWESVTNANNYKIYQIVDGEKVLKSTTTGTSITYANMPEGNYVYEVYSNSTRFGESLVGSKQEFTLTFPIMMAPENVIQTIKSPTEFTLNWDAVPYATQYKVYEIVNGQKKLLRTLSTRTTTFSNMLAGTYTYEIHSYSSRFGESTIGSKIEVTLNGQSLETPKNLIYTITNGNDITFKWDSVQYATSYRVYQIIDGERILKRSQSGTTYTLSNVAEGEQTFEVYAVSSLLGESPEGAQVVISLVHPDMEKPANLIYKVQNGNDVVLSWDTVQYATGYNVYELVGNEEELIRTVTSKTITLSNQPEGEHTYIVRSVSSRFGESVEGSSVNFTLIHPTMEAPAGLTQSIVNGNDIALKWTASTFATGYNIYQISNNEKVLVKTVTATSNTFVNMPEGEYSYEVHSTSTRFGESPESSKVVLTLIHPVMQAPAGLTQSIVNGNDIVLKWTASAYANNYRIYQVTNNEKVLVKTVTGTSNTFVNMPEGEYKYEVHSYSTRFGESLDSSKVELTLVHPTMLAPVNPYQTITNGNDIVLRWTASTYATGYNIYQIVDGEKVFKRTVTSTFTTFTNMPEGDYTYEIHSISNRFGESPESSEVVFNLTWPVVQPPVLSGSVFNANNITLTWKSVAWANEYRVYGVTDEGKELLYKGTALTTKVYNLTEDTHSFEVTAYSTRFGESIPSNTITETIVYPIMEPPTASLTLLSDTSARVVWNFITYANNYNIYEIIDGKQVLVAKNVNNLSYTIQNLSYANHEYVVTAYSNSFGESKPSNIVLAKLIKDTTAPVTTSNEQANWVNQNQIITLSATDDETGVAKTFYSLNDGSFVEGTTVSVSEEGVNKIQFYSVDKVGNKEALKTIYSKIDKTAPVTTSNGISENYVQSVVVSLSAVDAHSGVAKIYYSVNGSDYQEGTSVTIQEEGTNEVAYYSVDHAGNKEAVQTAFVKVDRTAPSTVSTITDAWFNHDVTVSLTSEDALSGVEKTFFSVNGSDYQEGTSFTVNQEGINEVMYYSVDAAGNQEAVHTEYVKVDKTAPVSESDISEEWSSVDVEVTLSASDSHSGVERTYYSINGSQLQQGTRFTVSQEGINEVIFYTIDVAGNKEVVQAAYVKIDKSAPTIEMDVNELYELGSQVQLTYTATDELSGVAFEEMVVTAPKEASGKVVENGAAVSLNKPGVYTVTVTAVDVVGNRTTITRQFNVYIPATIEITPKVIKGNKGVFTVRVDVPSEFEGKLDLDTATLNGVRALNSNKGYYNQAKLGQFKFERSDFSWTEPEVLVEFVGYVDGYLVKGHTTAIVKK